MNNALTFRSTKITYYGPHPCSQCGANVCKMAQGFGGNAFTYPDGPIYPNTEWHVHVCNPKDILAKKAAYARQRVLVIHPEAQAFCPLQQGWFISNRPDSFLSAERVFFTSEEAAWISAKQRVFPEEGESDSANDVIKADMLPKSNIPQTALTT